MTESARAAARNQKAANTGKKTKNLLGIGALVAAVIVPVLGVNGFGMQDVSAVESAPENASANGYSEISDISELTTQGGDLSYVPVDEEPVEIKEVRETSGAHEEGHKDASKHDDGFVSNAPPVQVAQNNPVQNNTPTQNNNGNNNTPTQQNTAPAVSLVIHYGGVATTQAQIDSCTGFKDVTSWYRGIPGLAAHWNCGGAAMSSVPIGGLVQVVGGPYAGMYKNNGVAFVLNHAIHTTGDLQNIGGLLVQTCLNNNSATMGFFHLTRV